MDAGQPDGVWDAIYLGVCAAYELNAAAPPKKKGKKKRGAPPAAIGFAIPKAR